MRKHLVTLFTILLLLGLASAAFGTPSLTFLNFSQAVVGPGAGPWSWNSLAGTLTATDVPVNITIADHPFLPLIKGTVNDYKKGFLTMTSSTTVAPTVGPPINQSMDGLTTIAIRTKSSSEGGGSLILGASFTGAVLTGATGGSSAAFFNTVQPITWTSDVISFAYYVSGYDGASQSYSSVTPPLMITTSGALRSFRADGTGTFSAGFVPEPSSLGLGLTATLVLGGVIWRRRRKTQS